MLLQTFIYTRWHKNDINNFKLILSHLLWFQMFSIYYFKISIDSFIK